MSDAIRILVADDHPLFLKGVIQSLETEPDLKVIGHASTGEDAIRMTSELLPDLLLMDITMPGCGGLVAVKEISVACPVVKIIMLTASEDEDDLLAAFKSGARGYVLKGVSARELISVIHIVAAGDVYVSPLLAAGVLMELSRGKAEDSLSNLTPREHDILRLVADGLTNREIGERLQLAEKTVKHYMSNVFSKLHLRNRVEAALLATRLESGR